VLKSGKFFRVHIHGEDAGFVVGKSGEVKGFAAVADTAGRLAAAAGVFGLPVLVVTEQVPDKLGATVAEVASRLPAGAPPAVAKLDFSMVVPAVEARLAAAPAVTSVVITGIEAHVCVLQTTLDLIERGYAVHLAVDGVSSQRHVDREAGLARAAAAGAHLSTSEMILFELARSAAAPAGKPSAICSPVGLLGVPRRERMPSYQSASSCLPISIW
jgi:nicotinamidase-related amidase